ncbi:hypothetical protein SKC42_12170, partial [Mycobacterium sp. 050134]
RKHHLLKTFWAGWRDKQFPDGTIEWTSPTGHTYLTHPGSRLLFPTLCQPTGEIPTPTTTPERTAHRALMMPTRQHTRTQDRARRIDTERALNITSLERVSRRAATKVVSGGPRRDEHEPPPF